MELRQLRYLVALAEEGSFTRAAEREHIAQPALSQQIQKLERELGLPLVERTTRRVSITDAGNLLVARARRVLTELESARQELDRVRGIQTGHVVVGAMNTMGPVDITLVLARFHALHPGVELTVREDNSDALAEMLRVDALDLAFLSVTERVESHGLALQQILMEELVVVLPQDHPLADRDSLRMAELSGEDFISYREGARLRELLIGAAHEVGFTPRIILESNESRRIRRLVGRGLGVAVLPRSHAIGVSTSDPVAVVQLVEPALARDITLAWRAGRRLPPAVAEFLALAREMFSPEELAHRQRRDEPGKVAEA
jgi:LysR family transcriptional regulator, transcription activator of glutamate synthase operon